MKTWLSNLRQHCGPTTTTTKMKIKGTKSHLYTWNMYVTTVVCTQCNLYKIQFVNKQHCVQITFVYTYFVFRNCIMYRLHCLQITIVDRFPMYKFHVYEFQLYRNYFICAIPETWPRTGVLSQEIWLLDPDCLQPPIKL